MTESYHGYYINGRAPWGRSDLPMAWLKLELDQEENNRRPQTRTLGAEDANKDPKEINSGTNTYEIFLQPNLRDNYDNWMDAPLE